MLGGLFRSLLFCLWNPPQLILVPYQQSSYVYYLAGVVF